MIKVLLEEGKKKENVYQNGSELVYLLEFHKENLTLQRRMYMNMDYTQFVKKQGVQMYMTAGLEGQQLSWSLEKFVLEDVDFVLSEQ